MHILVTGSRGFIGSGLVPSLTASGHRVTRLVRSAAQSGAIHWDPATGSVDAASLEGLDAVVHLAGENVATGRWTANKKQRIYDSRVKGTRLLSEALSKLSRPPQTLVCASAIGYYGNRGEEKLTEESAIGSGFLADVCRDWEAASASAMERGIRVVRLRFGVVLSPAGGPLRLMLPPFKMGLGGWLGSGTQYFSWIALDDVLGVIHHALTTRDLQGPVNTVSPNPVTNREFSTILARALSRPCLLPAPAFALRLALGEMADEALLSSERVIPSKLLAIGYTFRFPTLEAALRHLLNQ